MKKEKNQVSLVMFPSKVLKALVNNFRVLEQATPTEMSVSSVSDVIMRFGRPLGFST